MAETATRETTDDGWNVPSKYLPAMEEYRDLPEPLPLRKLVGQASSSWPQPWAPVS